MSPPSAGHEARNAERDAFDGPGRFLTAVFCGFAALLPIVSVVAPKGLAILLLLAAVLAVPAFRLARGRLPVPDRRIALLLALLVAWCAIASSWSADPGRSLDRALRVAAILAAGVALFPVAAALDDADRARVGRWLVGGFVLTLALMAVEVGLGYPAVRSFKEAPSGNEAVILSRGAIAMSLIVWPVAACLWDGRIGWKALVVPVLLGGASLFLESDSATLGLVAGVATALLVVRRRKVGRAVTLAAGVMAFVGSFFAAREMHDRGWHRADWLAKSPRHRVEIWDFSLERIAEKPFLGWGFDGSRHIAASYPGASEFGWDILPLHPHNAPLQIVLELGVVGAVIALALLSLIAVRLDDIPGRARDCGQALFVAVLAIGCVAFGQWQSWWLALIFSVALLAALTTGRDGAAGRRRG